MVNWEFKQFEGTLTIANRNLKMIKDLLYKSPPVGGRMLNKDRMPETKNRIRIARIIANCESVLIK